MVNLQHFFRKSEPFLLQAECLNNLFWEVVRKFREKGRTTWSGNAFEGGKICLEQSHYAFRVSSGLPLPERWPPSPSRLWPKEKLEAQGGYRSLRIRASVPAVLDGRGG